jgi:hypothetical protein
MTRTIKTFCSWDVDQSWLLPPSVHEFVPEGHLLTSSGTRCGRLDLSTILACYGEERGFPPYHPGMMVALLLLCHLRRCVRTARAPPLGRLASQGHEVRPDETVEPALVAEPHARAGS